MSDNFFFERRCFESYFFKLYCSLNESGSGRIQVAGFCEHSNEPSGCRKMWVLSISIRTVMWCRCKETRLQMGTAGILANRNVMPALVLLICLATGCVEGLRQVLKEGHHFSISEPSFITLVTCNSMLHER